MNTTDIIRPKTLNDFIGQQDIAMEVKIALHSAKARNDGSQCRLRRFAIFGSIIRLFGSNVKAVFQFKDIINKERN